MGSCKVSFKKSVEKDLRKLDRKEIPKIIAAIESLAENPFPEGSRKLVGSNVTHRIRIGDYRVVYFVSTEAREIVVQRVRHRKDVYE